VKSSPSLRGKEIQFSLMSFVLFAVVVVVVVLLVVLGAVWIVRRWL
jgi:hypothetical protein